MNDILNLNPLTVYALHKIGVALFVIGIISSILLVLSFVFFSSMEENKKEVPKLGVMLFSVFLITPFICLPLAALSPSWEEVKAVVALRAVNEVSQSDLGQKTQEVIISWLDNKLNNTIK